MASAKITGFEDVDKLFEELGDTKKIRLAAVKKAAPKLVNGARKAVKAAATKGYATGGLANSFVASNPKENEWGAFSVIKPVGKDDKGISYGARAAYLEYGTTVDGKLHTVGSPWRDRAINAAKEECEKIMEESILEEIEKL